jgi:DNA-binding MarR family transcriptional regulator
MNAIHQAPSKKHTTKSTTELLAPTKSPQGCTNLKLRQFMRQVAQFYDAEMSKVELKTTQYSLLSFVDKLGPIKPGELAASIKMDASTLTRNLKPLIDAGWVSVVAGSDARSRLVSLTEKGRHKRNEARRQWRVAQDGINALLGKSKVAELHALIDESMRMLDPALETDGAGL